MTKGKLGNLYTVLRVNILAPRSLTLLKSYNRETTKKVFSIQIEVKLSAEMNNDRKHNYAVPHQLFDPLS